MKNKTLKALLSKTVAVGMAASMVAGCPVMAADGTTTSDTENAAPTQASQPVEGGAAV